MSNPLTKQMSVFSVPCFLEMVPVLELDRIDASSHQADEEAWNAFVDRMLSEETVHTASGYFNVHNLEVSSSSDGELDDDDLTIEGIRRKFAGRFIEVFNASEMMQRQFMQIFRDFISDLSRWSQRNMP